MEMDSILNFSPNQLSFGKSPKGDFYFHMKGDLDGVDDIICYREVALDLLKKISNVSDVISVPDYKTLEMGKRENISLNGYSLDIDLSIGNIRESKGRNVFTFKSFTVNNIPENENSNLNASELLNEIDELKNDNLLLSEKILGLEGVNADLTKTIEELELHISSLKEALEAKSSFNNQSDIIDEIHDALDSDAVEDVMDGISESEDVLNSSEETSESSSELENSDDIEFGSEVDFGEGSPEDFAMSLMGSDIVEPVSVNSIEIEESVETHESESVELGKDEDPFDDTTNDTILQNNTSVKPTLTGISKPKIGSVTMPKLGGISVPKSPSISAVSKTEDNSVVRSEDEKPKEKEVETVNSQPKASAPKISAPKIGGFKAPKINISAPKIGGM